MILAFICIPPPIDALKTKKQLGQVITRLFYGTVTTESYCPSLAHLLAWIWAHHQAHCSIVVTGLFTFDYYHALRIDRLMLKVYRLALSDFTNSRLGSSCAALMEMLGRDSTLFRIDLQCANRIAKYGDGKQPKGDK